MLAVLRLVVKVSPRDASLTMEGLDIVLTRLQTLRSQEVEKATALSECRQRINELRRLAESSEAYGGALRVQRDRLALADWLRSLDRDVADPLVALGQGGREQLSMLCQALESLELQIRSQPSMTGSLDRETQRRRIEAEGLIAELGGIRSEIDQLERSSEAARAEMDRFYTAERFIGRLQQSLQLYDRVDESSGLRAEISDLMTKIAALREKVSEADVDRRTTSALNRIQGLTSSLVPQLDAEWQDAPIRLSIIDLTIKVLRDRREDYLWEIGSGANWLAYHVAMTLALQKFFLAETFAPTPYILVYDQPSQVYFPQRAVGPQVSADLEWRDQDRITVRKVFKLLGREVVAANGRLQIIVLDHADDDVWGGLPGVRLAEEWRGTTALVPVDWIT